MIQIQSNNTSFDYWVVGILTSLAFITRAFGLGQWDLLVDEFATYYYADERMSKLVNPLFYRLVHWSFQLFGQNELSARIPAMLLGVIGIPVFYWTWRHPIGRYAALIGAILILLSSWHLWYSQYSRFYSGVFLFGSLSFYLVWRATTDGSPGKLVLALLSNLIGVLFHLTSVIVPVACSVYLGLTLAFPRLRGPKFSTRIAWMLLIAYSLGGLLAIPLVWDSMSNWQGLGQHWGYGPVSFSLQVVKYVQVPIAVAAILGLPLLLAERVNAGILVISGIVVPGLILLVLSALTAVRPDYLFYSLPLVFAATGYLCATLFERVDFKLLASNAMVVVLAASQLPEFLSHYTGHRSLDVRETIAYIEPRLEPDDRILAMVSGYSHYADDDAPLVFRPGSPFDQSLDWAQILADSRPASGRLWIVLPATRQSYARQLEGWLADNTRLVWRKYERRYDYTFRGLEIYLTDTEDVIEPIGGSN